MRIVWLSSAENDLEALIDYISENSPDVAVEIFDFINKGIEKLGHYPLLGREGRVAETRELVIPGLPYIIVYKVEKEIQILAVLHTSRKWPQPNSD